MICYYVLGCGGVVVFLCTDCIRMIMVVTSIMPSVMVAIYRLLVMMPSVLMFMFVMWLRMSMRFMRPLVRLICFVGMRLGM